MNGCTQYTPGMYIHMQNPNERMHYGSVGPRQNRLNATISRSLL